MKDTVIRVALPIWERRISPVFDVAKEILIADIEEGKLISQFDITPREKYLPRQAIFLSRWRVKILICGGISAYLARLISAQGIDIVPGIRGNADEVIKAFCQGEIPSNRFDMAGWRGWGRKRHAVRSV
ncbi:MAG: NifB/NifX family molybdenum-iron cluster-binding protein [Elusimicrobiota bacterium]|nr:NifB/NifX family molybdenum-iron cluster-binding protein [Elusimicrobiota bacterium]